MKKIKLLSGIAGLSALSMGLIPTISSCNSNGYTVELVSELKERTFNSKTGGSAWTFKLADAQAAAKTKVKLVNLIVDGAETTSVSGLIKYSCDSAGNIKVTVKTNTLLAQWPSATKFEFSFEFINKETKQSTTVEGFNLSVNESIKSVNFCECDWSIIIAKTDAFYNGELTEADFFASFTTDGATAITKWEDFVGLKTSITINNKEHDVRVIGTKHDKLTTARKASAYAVFTFELVTLLSDSNGDPMKSQWDLSENENYDYTNSVLRWNLNHTGTQPTSGAWANSALGMLPTDISNSIKTVNKKVATWNTTSSTYEVKDAGYDDKLFPLTYTEMAQSGSEEAKVEGSQYAYWANHNTDNDRLKKDSKGNIIHYWLASPNVGDTPESVHGVSSDGVVVGGFANNYKFIGTSFAFCI